MPAQQTATFSNRVRRMLGFSLHHWENAMVTFLVIAGAFALFAGIATWAVVTLQRVELARSEQEAANARLETERLKAIVAWRVITTENATALEAALASKRG